jgi:hypothetical protein
MSESPKSTIGLAQDEIEPPYDDLSKQPKTLTKSRHIDNVFYLAGRKGNPDKDEYDLMFVCASADEEEMARAKKNFLGFHINQEAEYLRGGTGAIKLPASRAFIDFDDCYYTAVCKWLLPRTKRSKPPTKVMKWGLPILQDEIKRAKPKIIVCLGKPVFDLLSDVKVAFDDAHGGWFWSDEYKAFLYVMHSPNTLVGKPEYYEQFKIDFEEIHRQLARLRDGKIDELPVRYEVIRDEQSLRDWVSQINSIPDAEWPGRFDDDGNRLFAVDCEWHGRTYLDGNLRTIQFAWTDSDAVVIEFRNEQNEWSFQIDGEDGSWNGREVSEMEHEARVARMMEDNQAGMRAVMRHLRETVVDEGACQFKMMSLRHDPEGLAEIEHELQGGSIEDDIPEAYERKKYAYVGAILGEVMNLPNARFIGHQGSADFPWMKHWLGIDACDRCYMDTLYAQQAVDESSVLSLERGIAMRYTTLGLYNLDLNLWKREHKSLWTDGYGYIPSEIILPYSAKDVLTPFRAAPKIRHLLEIQYLWGYYKKILNPFVTDVFTAFHMEGLPTDVGLLDELRALYHFARERLDVKFKQRVYEEAKTKVFNCLMDLDTCPLHIFQDMQTQAGPQEALELVKPYLETDQVQFWSKLCQHLYDAPNFNIRSPDQMRTWLFDVHGLTPIKSTNQKAKGLPSMAWEKVLELPPERQRLYTPAVDKQTMQILSEEFDTLDELLNLNAVGNVCKAFLKKAEVYEDDDGQTVTEEQGILAWVSSDLRLRCNFSTTETSRSRTFLPNILNLPSYVNERIQRSIVRAISEAHEAGELPDELLRWVGEENIPSVRSCFKAIDGQVLVESDLKTAEMFGLAYISGDRSLMRILEEPDPEWAVLKPGRCGPYTRVCYSPTEETGIPFAKQNPDYIMSVWKNGEFVGKVTEDDLERNPDGSVKHRSFDIHWSVVERTYERPREEMVEKIHRNAGKVLNFCVAEDELVLTHNGLKPIQHVLGCDLLWDGVEWVSHEGVIYSGEKEVIEYQGLRATALHDVWVDGDCKIKLGEARAQSRGLIRSEETCQGYSDTGLADIPEICDATRERLLLRHDAMLALRSGAREGVAEHGEGSVIKMSVPVKSESDEPTSRRNQGRNTISRFALPSYGTALREGYARVVRALQGAWNHCGVQVQNGLRMLGAGDMAWGVVQGEGLRQDQQRRSVFDGKPTPSWALGEPTESGAHLVSPHWACEGVPEEVSSSELHGAHHVGAIEVRVVGVGDCQQACGEQESRLAKVRVYDIVNAGPRNRFTCQGVLVSNSSAYGASAASLDRKIESDTGVKPEPGTGQKGLEAIAARQPRATQFLEEMAEIPSRGGYYRAASGRIRHCVVHGDNVEVGWRTRQSIESALGREFRNFPMQESVAATAARACKWALDTYKNLGLKARPVVCLYDSLVTMCPYEERFIVAHLHQVFLSDINGWAYDDVHGNRMLRYGIDTEFNERWSTNVKAYQKKMEDPTFHPTPENLKWIMDFANWDLVVS